MSDLASPIVLRFLIAALLAVSSVAPAAAADVVADDAADEYVISGSTILNASTPSAGDAISCTTCHWRIVRICSIGSLDERRGCDQLPYPCTADRAEIWRADAAVIPPIGDPAWEYRGLMCLDSQPVPAETVNAAVADLVRQAVPPLRPGSAPTGITLTNLRTGFFAGQAVADPPPVNVAGAHVQLHLHPRWVWDFGHGQPLTSSQPGMPGASSTISHVYPRRGTYRVTVASSWTATYDVNGISGLGATGAVTQSGWFNLRVKEARRYSIIKRSTA